jgi:hypothetical protein
MCYSLPTRRIAGRNLGEFQNRLRQLHSCITTTIPRTETLHTKGHRGRPSGPVSRRIPCTLTQYRYHRLPRVLRAIMTFGGQTRRIRPPCAWWTSGIDRGVQLLRIRSHMSIPRANRKTILGKILKGRPQADAFLTQGKGLAVKRDPARMRRRFSPPGHSVEYRDEPPPPAGRTISDLYYMPHAGLSSPIEETLRTMERGSAVRQSPLSRHFELRLFGRFAQVFRLLGLKTG